MSLTTNDTIVAIATPLGQGGIGIIRLSGSQALSIIAPFFSVDCQTLTPRMMTYGRFRTPDSETLIDEGCLVYFKGPDSFTGEDVVELHLHGSPFVLKHFLTLLNQAGARLAGPGEFSKRAFINGKMDLNKAESLIDLIHAQSEQAYQVSLSHLQGGLLTHISTLRKTLMLCLEQMEGAIDFPDEVPPIDRSVLLARIQEVLDFVQRIRDQKDLGEMIFGGVKVLIMGPPNVGKSSLLNALIGKDRAIVSQVPGTTRDFIDVRISLGGFGFDFIDTAGIRETENDIEHEGIQKINDLLDQAHIILFLMDQSQPLPENTSDLLSSLPDQATRFGVLTKSDLPQTLVLPETIKPFDHTCHLSVKDNESIEALKSLLLNTVETSIKDLDRDLICNLRQQNCLYQVQDSLTHFISQLDQGLEDDVLTYDLKQAVLKLGEITGEDLTEEVLDGVFSRYCVGK